MERYSEYKDSGEQWLGEIPSHWEMRKAKYLWEETDARSESGSEQLLSVSQYDGVKPSEEESRSESLDGYKIVKKDELVINIMLAWLGGLGVSSYEGLVSPAYCVYKLFDKQNPKYLHYLYKTPTYLAEFARRSTGIVPSRWRMYTDDFGQVLTLLPPLSEQTAIVAYLDRVTSQLDEAIAQQQRMIDLLNERKQIIIQHAVTKGLDPKAEMVESGVEWIGKMPKGWILLPFKLCAKINCGRDYKHIISENGYPVIGSGGQFAYAKEYMYDGEVVFLGRKGTIDKPLYFNGKFWAVDTMFYAIPNERVNCKYLYYIAGLFPFKFYSTATALPSMTQSDLGDIKICVPQIAEQNNIVEKIISRTTPIDKAIKNIEKQIFLLRERKQIIINEVVTGKVKVS